MVFTATLTCGSSQKTVPPPAVPFEVFTIILQYVHAPRDLSALSQSCRVLHYLTAPRLLRSVWLDTSSSWQFLSAISTLQNPGYAANVQKLTLRGAMLSTEREEKLFVLAVGALVGGMTRLNEFRWEREIPVPKSLYEALSRNSTLKQVTILGDSMLQPTSEYPQSEMMDLSNPSPARYQYQHSLPPPQTPFILPAFRSISSLTITKINPLGAEDWSRIALGQLKTLRLSFHGSHALQNRPGGGLANIFNVLICGMRAIEKARSTGAPITMVNGTQVQTQSFRQRLQLEVIEFQNLYMPEGDDTLALLFDCSTLKRIVLLDCAVTSAVHLLSAPSTPVSDGGAPPTPSSSGGGSQKSFASPAAQAAHEASARAKYPNLKTFKTNMLTPYTIELLNTFPPLESLYILDPENMDDRVDAGELKEEAEMGKQFTEVIFSKHGRSLKSLRLCSLWPLNHTELVAMTRACPNLKEAAWATEKREWQFFHVILPFLELRTLQVLGTKLIKSLLGPDPTSTIPCNQVSLERAMAQEWFESLRYLAFMNLHVFRLQRKLEVDADGLLEEEPPCPHGKKGWRRAAKLLSEEEWPEGLLREGRVGIRVE